METQERNRIVNLIQTETARFINSEISLQEFKVQILSLNPNDEGDFAHVMVEEYIEQFFTEIEEGKYFADDIPPFLIQFFTDEDFEI